jgi:glycosyltransferase involved in cell wall biosynthesis
LNKTVKIRCLLGFKNLGKAVQILFSIMALMKFLILEKPDKLMVWGKEYAVISSIFTKFIFSKTKIIGVNASSIDHHLDQKKIGAILKYFYKIFLKICPKWIAQSQGVRDQMIEGYGIQGVNVVTVYPAISKDFFDFDLDLVKKKKEIIFVGRFESYKNPLFMIQSVCELLKENPEYTLRLLGDGNMRSSMESIVHDYGFGDRVIFVGEVTDIKPYLAQSQCMVLTSDFEGFGMVLVESIALGVPVVSLDCPFGPREIIEDGVNGYLVQDKSQFKSYVQNALNQEWNSVTLRDSVAKFHPNSILKDYEDAINAL